MCSEAAHRVWLRLPTLCWLQVQLLKAEGLKAMGAIDDLVDANRLNVQLLASVPAVVLVVGGSRLSCALLSMGRTRGLRSMRQVHAEMADVLIQHCVMHHVMHHAMHHECTMQCIM